ncbi:MAG: inositol monophosphatase [Candidatus Magasanikbacteria bacterium CG10_big_fil_rev_8_21_14_0_10_43_6]|uniref:Inositol-1-monophosphatase n=1 Tax=Candidatus Magasanikbacteria bacterium CG10_big_fil_rev_8_21_14_0_10_43_6 TaxID=1974650 RepID=A0A2M6W1C8_9BACT|nr:MAG: inositol monophosphatase [Candidatus Magasanikbacteria bacterium CG10_big_fil_rev_8_21_14_0_10_43_6]
MIDTQHALSVAVDAAKQAGDIQMSYFRKQESYIKHKNPRDILTKADLESEQAIIAVLQDAFPDHQLLCEESGRSAHTSEYLWVVDPLDGTLHFAKGHPDFAVLISLEKDTELLCSVIYFPATKELFTAEKGKGAKKNGVPIHVTDIQDVHDMIGGTQMSSNLEHRKKNLKLYNDMIIDMVNVHVVATCTARLLADVADGVIDVLFKKEGIHYWDYAAGKLLVEEAGGRVTDFQGTHVIQDATDIVATNGVSHETLLATLAAHAST